MAEHTLRGSRIGATSLQNEETVHYADRVTVRYQTDTDTIFSVTFASDAEIPQHWTELTTGKVGILLNEDGHPVLDIEPEEEKAPRTHWDMLLERRTQEELEALLNERLVYLRTRRGIVESA